MPSVQYGATTITYSILEKKGLAKHYIMVAPEQGVTLKGAPLAPHEADQLILKRAPWILEKLALTRTPEELPLVTGSRMPYLGRSYYVRIMVQPRLEGIAVTFTGSQFTVAVPQAAYSQTALRQAFQNFYRTKAKEKITPRLHRWVALTGWEYRALKFRLLERRWGSCTAEDHLILNLHAVKLPYRLIDYLLVHELAHTQHKHHGPAFWQAVAQYLPNYPALEEELNQWRG